MRRWLSLLALLALLTPVAARADGDPASDYLLTQPVFTPIDVKLPTESVARLAKIQKAAKDAGYEVRIALIATRYDLGAVPSLFGKPQIYAKFLHQEVRFVYKGPLLIVMPQGYGYYERGRAGGIDTAGRPDRDLAAAAVPVVQLLAKQHGVAVTIPPGGESSSNSRDRILIAVGAALLAAFAATMIWLRKRRTGSSE